MEITALSILDSLGGAGREISKALTGVKGAGTDLASLTQAGALRVESLDPTLFAVTVENKHFDLFNRLIPQKRNVWSMLDQQMIKTGHGAVPGSAVSSETATGRQENTGDYKRLLTEMGVFSDKRSVGVIMSMQSLLQQRAGAVDFNAVAEEDVNAALTILETVEHSLFYGDRNVSPLEINGLLAAIKSNASQNVLDMRGTYFSDHTALTDMASRLAKRPVFGRPDLIYCSTGCKSDLDNNLIGGYRLNVDKAIPSTTVGVPVEAFQYSAIGIGQGKAEIVPHAYIDEAKTPIQVQAPTLALTQAVPAAFAGAAVAAGAANSQWATGNDGAYFYCVEAVDSKKGGFSAAVVLAAAVTVAVGGAIDLTITRSTAATETHYNIYRGRKGGTNAPSDMRLIGRIACAGATTTFRDLNAVIPGTSEVFMLTSAPNLKALTWLQMVDMFRLPLAMTDAVWPWMVMLVGALRIPAAAKHGVVTNYLPKNALWKPF